MAKKCKKLEEIRKMVKNININYDEIELSTLNNFVLISKRLNDSREQYKIKHKMSDIVIITLLDYLQMLIHGMKYTASQLHTKIG